MSDIPTLLERFRRGPELMAVTLTGVFGEEEDYIPAPGKWSIRQLTAHVADTEIVAAGRFRADGGKRDKLTWRTLTGLTRVIVHI